MSDARAEDLYTRGWTYIDLGRSEEAVGLFQRAALHDPEDARYPSSVSYALYVLDDLKGAREYAERALVIDADYAWAHARRAYALHRTRELAEAERSIRTAIRLEPYRLSHRTELCSILLSRRQIEEAEQVGLYLVEQFPDEADAHSALGRVRHAQQRWDDSAECYRRALALAPTDTAALTNLGLALDQLGFSYDAAMLSHQSLSEDPTCTLTQNNLRGQVQRAGFGSIDEFLQSRADPALRETILQCAAMKRASRVLLDAKQWPPALVILQQAHSLNPRDLEVLDLLCEGWSALEYHGTALDFARRAIAISPEDSRGHWRSANALLCLSRHNDHRLQKPQFLKTAMHAAVNATNLADNSSGPLYTQFLIYCDMQRYQEAESAARRMILEHDNWWASYYALGEVFARRDKPAQAERHYLDALKIDPERACVLDGLAWACWRLDRYDAAETYATRALSMEPHNKDYAGRLRTVKNRGVIANLLGKLLGT